MAVNLRLRPDQEEALRAESQRTGRSQQTIMRDALDELLGTGDRTSRYVLPDWVIPASEPPRYVEPGFSLAPGESVLDLIDREERF